MRYLLLSGMALAVLTLAACSQSGGEDDPFFIVPPALTSFVNQQCNQTPENLNPSLINGADFGSDATPETTLPENSNFTSNCLTMLAPSS
mgnify:FL=1